MNFEKTGTLVLVAATILVAFSILLDGAAARLLNGAAGLAWFSAATLMAIAAWQTAPRKVVWLAAVGLTALVAFVVTPSAFVPAIVGFGVAGAAIAFVARRDIVLWAKVVVGLYLPLHIATAVAKAVYRGATGGEASLRTDPPPTAALVPLVMLLAAVASASLVGAWQDRRATLRPETGRTLRSG